MEIYDRLRASYIKAIGKCKETDLDKPYWRCSAGSFTRRELINEIEKDTEFARSQIDLIINMAIDLMERQK